MSRGRFAEAAESFIRLMPEQRQVVLQLTGNAGNQSLATSVASATIARDRDSFLARLSSSYDACGGPVVFDGCRHLWRGTLHSNYLERYRYFRSDSWRHHSRPGCHRGSGAIDLFLLFGFLLGIWAVPKFGRIRMQAIGFASMACAMLLLMIAVRLSNSSLHIPLVFTGFILFNLLMNAGPNSTTFTLAPILFPTQ